MRYPSVSIAAVAAVVRGYRFTYATEEQLQDGIAQALESAGYRVEREHVLPGRHGRIDLLVNDLIGVEVKITGGPSVVAHQIGRYLECEDLDGVVLVTGRARHAGLTHPRLEVVSLAGGAL